MSNLVIGIEGLVGAGKTTICRNLINKIPNTVLLNGGNLYRTVVASIIKNGKSLDDLVEHAKLLDIKRLMDILKVEIRIENNETIFYVDGKKLMKILFNQKKYQ